MMLTNGMTSKSPAVLWVRAKDGIKVPLLNMTGKYVAYSAEIGLVVIHHDRSPLINLAKVLLFDLEIGSKDDVRVGTRDSLRVGTLGRQFCSCDKG